MNAHLSTRAKSSTAERLEKLGAVTYLVTRTRNYQGYAAACLRVWLEPPIDFDQIRILYGPSGDPVGYVTWAWLAPDTEQRLLNDESFLLHPSEWTEGPRLWFLDFVAPFGHALDIVRALREDPCFERASSFNYLRRRGDHSIRYRATRGRARWIRAAGSAT